MSQEYAVARIEVPVALTADVERAEQVALDAAAQAIEDPTVGAKVLGEPEMLGVQELAPGSAEAADDVEDEAGRAMVGAAPPAAGDLAGVRRKKRRRAAISAGAHPRGGGRERREVRRDGAVSAEDERSPPRISALAMASSAPGIRSAAALGANRSVLSEGFHPTGTKSIVRTIGVPTISRCADPRF